MTDLSRRGFLRALAALAATSSMVPPAVALAPPIQFSPEPPPLPGVQDLQALIDRAAAAGVRRLYLPPGTYSCPNGPLMLDNRGVVDEIIGASP